LERRPRSLASLGGRGNTPHGALKVEDLIYEFGCGMWFD
jgi:hypothetical protein